MKHNIFKGLLSCGVMLALAGCSANSWNDEYLDGFEVPPVDERIEQITYELTPDDFTKIAACDGVVSYVMEKQNISKKDATTALTKWAEKGYFTDQYPANDLLPLWMNSYSFPYLAASNKSTIEITYKEQVASNPVCDAIYKGKVITLDNDDYMKAWGGNDFTNAFTPSVPASDYLPAILADRYTSEEQAADSYVLVNFNVAETEPAFVPVTITDIDKVVLNGSYTLCGTITAICAQGYILTDATGSLLVYYGKEFNPQKYKIGDIVQVSGKGGRFNGGLQLAPEAGKESVLGGEIYQYPTPVAMDGAKMNELRDDILANLSTGIMPVYVEFSAKVTSTGNYTNFKVEGGETTGSAYQLTDAAKKLFVKNETAAIKGYLMTVNIDRDTHAPTYVNFMITEVNGKAVAEMAEEKPVLPAPVEIESRPDNALYLYNGSEWKPASSVYLINQDELAAMGIDKGYMANATAWTNIPIFLKQTFPYAAAGDSKLVAFQSGEKYANCAQFDYDGTAWTKYDNIETKTAAYAKVNNEWIFNPDKTIILPRSSAAAKAFYQVTVDWVSANEGSGYIDRGNSEFFSGCSAHYGNVNLDISQVEKYAASMWPDLSQNVVIPQMRNNFLYVTMPATLKELYPNADLIPGYESPIIYEIDYVSYYGSSAFEGQSGNVNDTVKYEVKGPGDFKLVYSTWLGGKVETVPSGN